MGLGTVNAATCQWYRVKKKFDEAQSKNSSDQSSDVKPGKANTGKKRTIEDISAGEEKKVVRTRPAKKKGRGRKAKKEETPETEIEEEILQDDEDEID